MLWNREKAIFLITTSIVNKYLYNYLPKWILSRTIAIYQACLFNHMWSIFCSQYSNITFLLHFIHDTTSCYWSALKFVYEKSLSKWNHFIQRTPWISLQGTMSKDKRNFKKRVCLQFKDVWLAVKMIFQYRSNSIN